MTAGTLAPEIGACGHEIRKPAHSIGTGYARTPEGLTVCYPCADTLSRVDMARNGIVGAYVNAKDRTITTWTGGELARITELRTVPLAFGFAHKMRHVWATAPDGSRWFGRGSDAYDAITLRRLKRP